MQEWTIIRFKNQSSLDIPRGCAEVINELLASTPTANMLSRVNTIDGASCLICTSEIVSVVRMSDTLAKKRGYRQ